MNNPNADLLPAHGALHAFAKLVAEAEKKADAARTALRVLWDQRDAGNRVLPGVLEDARLSVEILGDQVSAARKAWVAEWKRCGHPRPCPKECTR